MKRITSIAIAATAALGIIGTGASTLYAAQKVDGTNPMSGLVNAIAQKFNLNPTEVQQIFDQQRALMGQEMQAKHQEKQKTVLDQAVKNGKITQAQEDLIIAKQAELKTLRESLKDKTEAERQTAMKAQMESFKQWATDNKIPESYLMGFGPGGKGRHGRMPFGGHQRPVGHDMEGRGPGRSLDGGSGAL